MRIAVWHNLPSGGAKRALYDEVRELARRGHVVESWCPDSADQSYLPLGALVREHVLPLAPPPRRGPLARLTGPYHATVERLRAMDDHCRRAAAAIDAGGFDLLYANACRLFRVTAVGRFARLPKVVYVPEPYRPLYEAMPALPWAAPESWGPGWWRPRALAANARDALRVAGLRVQVREEARNARAYQRILANSRYSRESILRAYGLDSHVRYHGVDLGRFAERGLPRENMVVSVGALTPEKNAELVVRALALVPEPRPRLVWIANVARAPYLERVRALARACGVALDARVGVSDDELTETLGRALAMVYAPRLEPFGLAPLEAGACGTPVVAVAEAGVRETVEDGVSGLLVEHDAAAMAAAIARLRDDPGLARGLGARGAALVSARWPLAAAVDRLERELTAVLEAR